MSVPTITYSQIVDAVKSAIKSKCVNIANFAGIANYYKSGYSHSVASYASGSVNEGANATIANPVTQVATGTVDSEMTDFLNSVGVSSSTLGYPIDDANFLPFILNMTTFFATKVCFAMSNNLSAGGGTDGQRILVYYSYGVDLNQTLPIAPKPAGSGSSYTISTSNLQTITDRIINSAMKAVRVHPVKYNLTCR